jgi:hypothetical protein
MNKPLRSSLEPLRPPPPPVPRSLGTLAAALVSCAHPQADHVDLPACGGAGDVVTWCAACGALRSAPRPAATWRVPALAALLTKKQFEDLVLLLHATAQLAGLARAHASPAGRRSADPIVVRLSASLAELARLPVVRDVDRLEEVLAQITRVHP